MTSGVKDVRDVLADAAAALAADGTRTLLFIDEIHRFNKAQQDALLPDVEDGTVVLVGATTANPFFAVNDALVSRSRIFEFKPLSVDDVKTLLRRAIADRERGLGALPIEAAVFYDAGLAWTQTDGARLFGTGSRRMVSSAGVALRLNIFGAAILELDYVRPFDRPAKNWLLRLNLTEAF